MEEIWRKIGEFEISNYGRCKSIDRMIIRKNGRPFYAKGKILSQHIDDRGYLRCSAGKIHKLVAEAFIPNPNHYTIVHHKDHNKLNNCVSNLEWIDETKHNRMHGGRNPCKRVYQYTPEKKLLAIYNSVNEAARMLHIGYGNIARCCRGEQDEYKGYIWSYKPLK